MLDMHSNCKVVH